MLYYLLVRGTQCAAHRVVGDIFVQKYLCVCSKIIIWTYVTNTLHNIIYSLSPWHEFASCLGFEAVSAAATYLLEFAHF